MSGLVQLDGGLVVVTGAGGGIGAAAARRFAQAGATVLGVDIDGEAVAEVCQRSYVCDVADATAVQDLADRVAVDHGQVDVLVNNAGVGIAGPFLDGSVEDWRWLRSVNIDGVAHGCFAFGPVMVQRGRGHVVNVASGAAYVPNRNLAAYCASKAAVVSLSQCLRADWRAHGVGVSVVCSRSRSRRPAGSRTRSRGA